MGYKILFPKIVVIQSSLDRNVLYLYNMAYYLTSVLAVFLLIDIKILGISIDDITD